ncbi:ComF family protein [Luteimonas sp. SX5]|uniref:ComF family protein n=1 Tax=Luteimonas galliterrae TaxID=2940486 RepID=A0ABT0MMJ2_9GAMM|nr:ComF family protein [Luteimonas galliterrae]MCL1636096.1 ComF family protein [Luteimonas galliterrae]
MPAAVNRTLSAAVDGLGKWLWPLRCLLCGETGAQGRDLCRSCAAALPWNRSACLRCALPLPVAAAACGDCLRRPPGLHQSHAALVYGFPVDRLLPRLKFHADLACGRLLSQLMIEAFAALPRSEALIPLPLHRARLRSRGYDQALELARPLSRAFGIPMLDGVLTRSRATPPQSRLDADARRRNLRGAFAVARGAVLPQSVTLIDDVMTTGATLDAAAKALRRAGASRIDAWVCARTP